MVDPLVTYDVTDGLGQLTLRRPQMMNAVTPALIDDLTAATAACLRSEARVLVIAAEGANFCVGADLKHFADKVDRASDELAHMAEGFHQALANLSDMTIPIITAVQGHAVGAGFGLALMGDVMVASENARFSTGYGRLGLSADAGVSWSLTRALGVRQARALLLTGKTIDAQDGLRMGLLDQVVAAEDLEETLLTNARICLAGTSPAHAEIKRLTAAAQTSDFKTHLADERRSVIELAKAPRFSAILQTALGR